MRWGELLSRYWWELRSCEVGGVVVEVLVGTEIL